MLDNISQSAIFILSILATFMVARKNKWGFVVGFISQPFWIYSTYKGGQWGIFAVSVVYIFVWLYGIYNWFWKK